MERNKAYCQGSFISEDVSLGRDITIGRNVVIEGEGRIGNNVTIGNGTVIEGNISIGDFTQIDHNVIISGNVTIGKSNKLGNFSCFGAQPQDLNAVGKDTRVIIGDGNVFREYVTVHIGTHDNTIIGDKNYIMTNVTVNHDCKIHNNCILTTQSVLGGYVEVLDYGYLGFGTMCHQFVRIGSHAFTGMNSRITHDIPPYVIVSGEPLRLRRINTLGLQRRGFSDLQISRIIKIYQKLTGVKDPKDQLRLLKDTRASREQLTILGFYENPGKRGIQWI